MNEKFNYKLSILKFSCLFFLCSLLAILLSYKSDLAIQVFSLIVCLLCFFTTYCISSKSMTSTMLFMCIYTIYIIIPAFISFYNHENLLYVENSIISSTVAEGAAAFVFGAWIIILIRGKISKNEIILYINKEFTDNIKIHFWIPAIIVAFLSLFLSTWYLFNNISDFDIFSQHLKENRVALRSGQGYYVINFIYILPILTILLYLKGFASKKGYLKFIAAVLFIYCFGAQSVLMLRGNLIILSLLIFMAIHVINFRMPWKTVIPVLLISISSVFFVSFLRFSNSDNLYYSNILSLIISKTIDRFLTTISQLSYILSKYSSNINVFSNLTYLIDLKALLPGPDVGFNGIIYKEMGYWGQGTATVTILGEFYANFGHLGIIIGMFTIGAILQHLHLNLIRGAKKITDIFWYITFSIYIGKSCIAGIGENLFPAIVVILSLILGIKISSFILKLR